MEAASCPIEDVYLLGKWWTLEDRTEQLEDEERMGETKMEQCRVLYSTKQNSQQLRDTIWHELKHAVFHEVGLTLVLKDHAENVQEEDIIRRITPVELTLMRENPELMEWLLGD